MVRDMPQEQIIDDAEGNGMIVLPMRSLWRL